MLRGLELMEPLSKAAFAEEIGLQVSSPEQLTWALVEWMGRAVGVNSSDPKVVELSVLHWFAKRLEMKDFETLSIDDLEAAVRRKVAEDSHDFLFPFMEIGSAIAYLGPETVVGPKLELLEASTAGLIPSQSARERMRRYWDDRGARLLALQQTLDPPALINHLSEPLEILRQASQQTKSAVLSLSHVVALSDGRFELEEEHFTRLLAQELGLTSEQNQQIGREVGQAFWRHLRELEGSSNSPRSTGQELALTVRAAQLALESCGSLASFSEVVERGFVGSLHSTLGRTQSRERMKGWRMPLGFATGMLCFIRDRWKSDRHETLVRLILAGIYQQHLHFSSEQATITEDDLTGYLPQRVVENPADILAETVVGEKSQKPVRRISLEPTRFDP